MARTRPGGNRLDRAGGRAPPPPRYRDERERERDDDPRRLRPELLRLDDLRPARLAAALRLPPLRPIRE